MIGDEYFLFILGGVGLVMAVIALTRTHYRRLGVYALIHIIAGNIATLFPLQLAALLTVWLTWVFLYGAPASLMGWAGVSMGMFAIVGFLVFLVRQFQVRNVLAHVLDEAYGEVSDTVARLQSRSQPNLWRVLRPLHFAIANVERIRDLSYGPGGIRNHLDIFRPSDIKNRQKLLPVLIQIHGSGWMVTNKNMHALPLMNLMASQGWIVVNINYRLSPASRFPAHLLDVKLAIAWVRNNIEQYGGDKNFIALTGGSAGGHLAALAALTTLNKNLQPGFESMDTSVKAVVPLYGRYDFLDRDHANKFHEAFAAVATRYIMPGPPDEAPDVWELASPIAQIHADAPPFFIVHGGKDSLIPVEIARIFVNRMRTVSTNNVVYAELPPLHHGFDMVQSPATEFTIHAVHRFLEIQYHRYLDTAENANPITE